MDLSRRKHNASDRTSDRQSESKFQPEQDKHYSRRAYDTVRHQANRSQRNTPHRKHLSPVSQRQDHSDKIQRITIKHERNQRRIATGKCLAYSTVFENEMSLAENSEVALFADDTTVSTHSTQLADCFDKWKLKIISDRS